MKVRRLINATHDWEHEQKLKYIEERGTDFWLVYVNGEEKKFVTMHGFLSPAEFVVDAVAKGLWLEYFVDVGP